MRIKAIMSYKGTNYFGFQIQPSEKEKTIQGEIQKVLSKIFSCEIKIYASGRTDRGVHAINQCFHFDVDKQIDLAKLKHSLNSLLPQDMHIKSLEQVDDKFHARFNVTSKTYRYIINMGEYDPLNNDLVYNLNSELDLDLMLEAKKLFIGEHSFHNFCTNDEDFIRKIESIEFKKNGDLLIIDLTANGFRRYMVRMIVGTLIEVGLNKLSLEKVKYYLSSNMDRVSYKAISSGLYLYQISYGGNKND